MRRLALRIFLVSVALNGALAIGVLLAGDFGETEGQILLTSLCVTGAALLAFACEAGRTQNRLGPIPAAGSVAAVAGFVLLIVSIWTSPEGDVLPKLSGTFLTTAVGAALLSLVTVATLAPRFQWVFAALVALTALVVAMLVSGIWGEWQTEWFWRSFGVVAVALAAFAVVVPVLHRVSSRELVAAGTARPGVLHCPRCGRPLAARAEADAECPACGARFVVRFR